MKPKFLLPILLFLALVSCKKNKPYQTFDGGVWTTEFHIVYCSETRLGDSILSVFRQVENSLSPFAPTSLISMINRGEGYRVDSLLRNVFLRSVEINRISGGAFDPTVAPLVNLWGFGYKKTAPTGAPTDLQIDSARSLVGIGRCYLRGDSIILPVKGMEFNFSAITKGYACDLVADMFRRNGVTDFMVEIGGEVVCSGVNPYGQPWRIQIDSPKQSGAGSHDAAGVIELRDCAVATSGNYRRFVEQKDGSRTWHTINPATGRPAETTVLSATVIAPDCMTADALATTAMVLPADSMIRLIDRLPSTSVMLITAAPDGSLQTQTSPFFPPVMQK